MGKILGIISGAISAIGSLFSWLKGRQDAAAVATQQQAGVNAQAASDNAKGAQIAQAEGQAVNDTPSDNEGLAGIADKGKW